MATPTLTRQAPAAQAPPGRLRRWLLRDMREPEGPHEREGQHRTHPWWQVMCLTGVDYFSTLGYQPGIAALAAGTLSPIATLILVLITLFGALPMYRRVANESPHGDGSISMLERLLSWWQGKLFVLALIGFVATGFVITITLSAADAAAHVTENPYLESSMHGREIVITLVLLSLLGAVFLKGFGEAIGIAVVLVAIYIGLNLIVVGTSLWDVIQHPTLVGDWKDNLFEEHGNPFLMIGAAMLLFPKLALGLSGFETGVVVMPLVEGDPSDPPARPTTRIHNTHKLLASAAVIMSVLLIASSFATITLIPEAEFEEGGEASGRALAYLAHEQLGDVFGTIYDASTILILWFAGASALAGLLNIVPRYLPRYGMAPVWARANRPLVLIFIAICFVVTLLFRASVNDQAGAYATGVLAVMTSATIAVTLSTWRSGERKFGIFFGAVAIIFIYTTLVNIIERPEGLQIAFLFIAAIVVVSLISRVWRSTELRATRVNLDANAQRFIDAIQGEDIRIIANEPNRRDFAEYRLKEAEQRRENRIPPAEPVLFLEVTVRDASEFEGVLRVTGEVIGGYRILRMEASSIANGIAAFLMYLRDTTERMPHVYFHWTEGNPLKFLLRFIIFGQGDIAPVTHEILRQAEPDIERRPVIHVS